VSLAPLLPAVLELKTIVDSVRWLNEHYIGGEETVSKAICWRGLIFEASCAYLNISPPPQPGPCLLLKTGAGPGGRGGSGGSLFSGRYSIVQLCVIEFL
jgi:hypothetical protein